MQDKLLQYQTVYGVKDATLKEKLLQERGLTLSRCSDMYRAAELATKQAEQMADSASEVNRITTRCPTSNYQLAKSEASENRQPRRGQWMRKCCNFCSRSHPLILGSCPAQGQWCNKCNRFNHFTIRCQGNRVNQTGINLVDDQAAGSPAQNVRSG